MAHQKNIQSSGRVEYQKESRRVCFYFHQVTPIGPAQDQKIVMVLRIIKLPLTHQEAHLRSINNVQEIN